VRAWMAASAEVAAADQALAAAADETAEFEDDEYIRRLEEELNR